ncbi:hypothetical protein CAEBREN_07310 [Caenorhabditis brenneri]|uniref:Uncharacterized protein n=1 Tax=Caenorhabditis brenneri TaxID=135651 RepID=G0MK82_CAEBE|nr:hypothetical protein CAEBREN_07310 [Caenorhabditis brenneri]
MLKSLLSLVTSSNKEKKKKRSTAGLSVSSHSPVETSFFSEADASILNDTSVTIPIGEGRENTSILSTSRVLGDSSFSYIDKKSRAVSFDFCLSDEPQKDFVVHRRSLQPVTPTSNHSDAEHSFIENIFDSPGQRNRLHSMIGESIYEAGNGSPQKMNNNNLVSEKF